MGVNFRFNHLKRNAIQILSILYILLAPPPDG